MDNLVSRVSHLTAPWRWKDGKILEHDRNSFCWGPRSTLTRQGRVNVYGLLQNKYARCFVCKVVRAKQAS